MSPQDRTPLSNPPRSRRFATTRWSIVVAATRPASPVARRALASLCETYWHPLYSYIRSRGLRIEEAQDLTQAFFAWILEKDTLRVADPGRGRFRSFLLAALKNFLANHWRAESARKRSDTRPALSLDFHEAESRYSTEPGHELTAERVYERKWALTLLDATMNKLSAEQTAAGKEDLFARLRVYLGMGDGRVPYREIADSCALSEGAVKVAVHRLRQRYRDLLRGEIAHTVARPEDIDDELRSLLDALSQ